MLVQPFEGFIYPCCDGRSENGDELKSTFGNVVCTGEEKTITECSYEMIQSAHHNVGVHCQQGLLLAHV